MTDPMNKGSPIRYVHSLASIPVVWCSKNSHAGLLLPWVTDQQRVRQVQSSDYTPSAGEMAHTPNFSPGERFFRVMCVISPAEGIVNEITLITLEQVPTSHKENLAQLFHRSPDFMETYMTFGSHRHLWSHTALNNALHLQDFKYL